MAETEESTLHGLAMLAHVERLIETRITQHEDANGGTLEGIYNKLDSLEKLVREGFPQGDPAAHRRVHERYIEEAQEKRAMIMGAKQKVFEMSVWGALVVLSLALFDYFKEHLK